MKYYQLNDTVLSICNARFFRFIFLCSDRFTLCDSFSRGGRLSRILLMACRGGSLK